MLEAKLCKRAERGRDLTVPPIRLPAIRVPGAAREAAPRDVQPADPAQDPRLPTEEEIAEEVRRRPVGAVIVDICCDLGIAPGRLDRAFWDEINHALMVYGGSSVRFFNDPGEAAMGLLRRRRPVRPSGPRMQPGSSTAAGARHRAP